VYNYYTNISALWTWAVEEGIVEEHIVREIQPPRFEKPEIVPYTEDEVKKMLKACRYTRRWRTNDVRSKRPTAERDQAILLLLLDTGVRASELCDLCIIDLNLATNTAQVRGKGRGRDKKGRVVPFGSRTTRAIWRYLTPRVANRDQHDPVFTVGPDDDERPLHRDILGQLVRRIGDRAGVNNAHPHRFRHTFAITYLRNDGDIFTLQRILGHSDLTMVKRYLAIVQTDIERAHQKASPVDNWRL
jgi:site-specific recombinase XerD